MEVIKNNKSSFIKLVIATLSGIIFFMVPFTLEDGSIVIPYSMVTNFVCKGVTFFGEIILVTMVLSTVLAIFFTYIKKDPKSDLLKGLFVVTPATIALRTVALIVTACVYFQIGHSYIYDPYTGGLVVNELMPTLFVMFFLACTFMPLLLDFGAMELFGALFKPVMRSLFKLPGMSSLLAIGGWVGGGTIAMLSTSDEYEEGRFTAKESAILVLGFCTISLPSTFVYSTAIGGLDVAYFPIFYLTCILCGVITTVIIGRIPPISKKANAYIDGRIQEKIEKEISGNSSSELGMGAALVRAEKAPNLLTMIKNGSKKTLYLYIDACPIIIFVATLALVISEFTPVFTIMAIPLTPVLEAIGLPEAAQAGPSFIVGFVDLLLPFLGAGAITSQLTKFVICVVGVIQIICLSETGAVVLKSKLPINVLDLALVVLEKTIITIPIALIVGKMAGLV